MLGTAGNLCAIPAADWAGCIPPFNNRKRWKTTEHCHYSGHQNRYGNSANNSQNSSARETIVKYARQDVAFLRQFDLKAVVIACGTVSTTALEVLTEENAVSVNSTALPDTAAGTAPQFPPSIHTK